MQEMAKTQNVVAKCGSIRDKCQHSLYWFAINTGE